MVFTYKEVEEYMVKLKKGIVPAVIFFFCICSNAAAQKSYEFIHQSIEEIVYALSLYEKITIVCDDTVRGNASFRYAGSDFNSAFDAFLESSRLYVMKEKDQWTVSKIRVYCDDEGSVQLDCYDAPPSAVLEKLSLRSGLTIVYDIIPSTPISLHISNMPVKEAVVLILNGSGTYDISEDSNKIRITKKTDRAIEPPYENSLCLIEPANNEASLFNASISKTRAYDAVEQLCSAAGQEVIQTVKNDALIEKITLKSKSFIELLSVICLQSSSSWVEDRGVYYILPSSDGVMQLKNTGRIWRSYSMKYKTSEAVQSIFVHRFPSASCIRADNFSLLIYGTETLHKEISIFLNELDTPDSSNIISLQFIKASDFLKNIPPSFRKEDFKETGDESVLFYTGSPENYKILCGHLSLIDIPIKRITYDLLIIQYQESKDLQWTPSFKARPVSLGDALIVSAGMDSVLDLQFNIISSFGLTFAAGLNTAIKENKAKVFADTRLHGVSGKPIKFQNTSTYRYRDTVLDPSTGKAVNTGVTREIISGLILDIEGWISGDGMITTTVSASVSKRGADVSSSIGNPPPTYEKIVTTQVRSRSGESVVLSGLVQDDDVLIQERMPLLSKIPVLGLLFTSKVKTNERTEMVIYLIPHAEDENSYVSGSDQNSLDKCNTEKRNERIYTEFIFRGEADE